MWGVPSAEIVVRMISRIKTYNLFHPNRCTAQHLAALNDPGIDPGAGKGFVQEGNPDAVVHDGPHDIRVTRQVTLGQGGHHTTGTGIGHLQNDLITQWGGPNADNVYRHTRVDPARRYRITGRMHSCDEFILAIRRGFMHEPQWGTVHEVSATDLGIGPGDDFEILLGGPDRGPGRVPLPDGAVMASFREYYYDWAAAEPAVMVVECLDDDADPPAPRLTPADVTARLARAADGIAHSVHNWNDYLRDHRARGTDNVLAPPMVVAQGLDAARYAFCFWDLGPDEAVVIETTVPAARYWSIQAYELGTYELIDITEHQSSLNHRQVYVDPDGMVRIVARSSSPSTSTQMTGHFARTAASSSGFWTTVSCVVCPSQATRRSVAGDAEGCVAAAIEPARSRWRGLRRRRLRWGTAECPGFEKPTSRLS